MGLESRYSRSKIFIANSVQNNLFDLIGNLDYSLTKNLFLYELSNDDLSYFLFFLLSSTM